jgi:tRNA1(Val) A37 N6-methylase TrmN6
MYQRVTRNYAKNGYFPTDEQTTAEVLARLSVTRSIGSGGVINVLDPCCGEGAAISECGDWLDQSVSQVQKNKQPDVRLYGVELDRERAYMAKQRLTQCLHGDINDTLIQTNGFHLLWLNPPYGLGLADQQQGESGERLEKMFYQRTFGTLCMGGVLVFIIPHYVLDKALSQWLCRHFTDIECARAAVDTYKQVVIMGTRTRYQSSLQTQTHKQLMAIGQGEVVPPRIGELRQTYTLPVSESVGVYASPRFESIKPDSDQLGEIIARHRGLWSDFDRLLSPSECPLRPPLCALSDWHLSLMLAAGAVSGVVTSNEGQTLLVKGQTHKEKSTKVTVEESPDGSSIQTQVSTDKFMPKICGIDFTPESLGTIVTIQ